jgi:hypothetical protein
LAAALEAKAEADRDRYGRAAMVYALVFVG